jgi:MFS family permease
VGAELHSIDFPPRPRVQPANMKAHIFYGWWVVLASAVGLFLGVPITVYCFSVFLKPLMQEFHAGRGAVSLGFTLHLLAAAFSAPLAGWLIDRYGSRKVILVGTLTFGLILVANRLFSGNLSGFYFFCVLLGIALHGVGPIPYGDLVSRWFDRNRGLAIGLMMLGIGLGAMFMPSLAQHLIAKFGWHAAYAVLGGVVLLIALPTGMVLLRTKPEEFGLSPDGTLKQKYGAPERGDIPPGVSAKIAWRSGTFWVMVCSFFLVSASVQGCVIHMAAMLGDRGVSIERAALGSSLVGVAVLIGRVGTGCLLDRLFAPRLAAAFFGGSSLGIALLWLGVPRLLFAGAFLIGLGLGAEVDFIAYLTSRYFGLRAFGKIYSSIFAAFGLSGALGPLIMGVGFDRTGSYRAPLVIFFFATLLGTVVMTRLGPYGFPPPRSGTSDA